MLPHRGPDRKPNNTCCTGLPLEFLPQRRHARLASSLLCFFLAQNRALGANSPPEMPVAVEAVRPLTQMSRSFWMRNGWTGGDGAYSIPLGRKRSLWFFGDSFIGTIEGERRIQARMIHNACAWQEPGADKPLQFFWKGHEGAPEALLAPERKDTYYWPGDCAMVGGRLYLFSKRISDDPQGQGAFKFKWTGDDILEVTNPTEKPVAWRLHSYPLPGGELDIHPGTSCLVDGSYLYVFCTREMPQPTGLKHSLVLARIKTQLLAALNCQGFEYFCQQSNEAGQIEKDKTFWSPSPVNPVVLFEDAAPEMTVSRIKGLKGFFAVYSPFGLSDSIFMRFAEHPEGPWSRPLQIYRCPEAADKKLLCYGAKAHSELSSLDRQLIVTYCLNPGDLPAHIHRPFVYFPHFVQVSLRVKPQMPDQSGL